MGRMRLTTAVVLAMLVALGAVGVAIAEPLPEEPREVQRSEKLRRAVEPAGILVHERRFQRIANANDGTRASGTPGYDASAAYVSEKLRAAGYRVSEQTFEFPFFRELAAAELRQVSPDEKDYETATFEYSASGDVTGTLVPTNDVLVPPPEAPGSTSGCEPADFAPASETEDQVALIQRGTCTFGQKAQNAEAAGYDAVVIFNEGQPGREEVVVGTLGGPDYGIPVVGASFATGQELYAASRAGEVVVRVFTSTLSETRTTSNVIADSREGRRDRTIVVGAHLDSVPEGPGINDNGSGSAAILETALQLAKVDPNPRNRLRFAFWGAEESGLLGSTYYVENLTEEQRDRLALNLNFDMVGSPNYVRFVYDGDGSDTGPRGPAGSAEIERTFNEYFASRGLETDPTEFSGRSDYGPFIANGIPAGGLFTGAEGIKTPEQAAVYGGTAGEAYDPCYHEACDDISNLNVRALGEMSDGVAHATYTYAEQRSLFEPDSRAAEARPVKLSGRFEGPDARK